jgi:hypothetical protein
MITFARSLLALAFLALSLAAHGRSLLRDNEAETVYQARDLLARVSREIGEKDYRHADYLVSGLLASPVLPQLDEKERLAAYRAATKIALELDRLPKAYEMSLRSTASPDAAALDWLQRVAAGILTGRSDDAIVSLRTLVQTWPHEASIVGDNVLLSALYPAGSDATARSQLHADLIDLSTRSARFRKRSELWSQLAWRSMNPSIDEAGPDLPAWARPYMFAAMRADRRYDSIVAADPLYFDSEAVTLKQLDQLREEDQARSNYLEPSVEMMHMMPVVQMNEAAVRLADDILEVRSKWHFSDRADYRPMIADYKARALWQQARWTEAVNVLDVSRFNRPVTAAEYVRLGWAFAMLGEPTQASLVLQPSLPSFACESPELETLLLAIAAQRRREDQVSQYLEHLSTYEGTAFWYHQWGLVAANRLDEAAARLISNLRDPDRRLYALMQLQSYAQPEAATWEDILLARWRGLLDRPDVKQAIAEVGRIDRYAIAMPFRRAMLGAPVPYGDDRKEGWRAPHVTCRHMLPIERSASGR